MARVDPLPREALAEFEDGFEMAEAFMGFVPNSMMTMARVPGLLPAFQGLTSAVFTNQSLPHGLTQLVALMASTGAECRYCQAHTGHTAEKLGVDAGKLDAIWEFETSDAFDDSERAALRLAFHSGQVPNAATDDDFAACREYFDDEQIASIVAVCALFGYLNRWNDTMATDLEDSPTEFGERVLAAKGWSAGRHAGGRPR